MSDKVLKKLEQEPNYKVRIAINILIVLVLSIWSISGLSSSGAGEKGVSIVGSIFKGIFTPDWSLYNFTEVGIPYLLVETIAIAFIGTLFGAILAIPFAFLISPNILPRPIAYIFRILLVVLRTVPTVIYGLIFIRAVGPGPFAGVLTMALTSIGMISKLMSESIQDLQSEILESLSALGMNTFQKIRHGVLPQLSGIFISTIIYRFDINLRDATVLGLVGAGGIGAPLLQAIYGFKWTQAGSILLGLIVLVLVIEFFSSKIRNKLVKGF